MPTTPGESERCAWPRWTWRAGGSPREGTGRELACDLVLLAMGFTGAEESGLLGSSASA